MQGGAASHTEFHRAISRLDATAIVAGSMIGSGVFIVAADMLRTVPHPGLFLLVWVFSGVITLLGAAYFAFVLYSALVTGHTAPGWGSVISVVLGLGGLQLLFTGLIGEYLSRLYEEAKGRPLYVLKQLRLDASRPRNEADDRTEAGPLHV